MLTPLLWACLAHAEDPASPASEPPPAELPAPPETPAQTPTYLAPPEPVQQTFPGMMNPAISLNGLFVAGAELDDGTLAPPQLGGEAGESAFPSAGGTFGTGLNVQEMELQIAANVDPFFKANIILAIPGTEGVEVEEGYVQLLSLPRTIVTIGKIKEAFGRENPTHTHGWLTVDNSLIGQALLGGEGLNDVGVNAAVLLPTPWYSELTASVDRGSNEGLFNSGNPTGFGYLAHWKNQIDLSYESSIELGLSGAAGENDGGGVTKLGGVDVTFKSHGRGQHQFNRVIWQSELMFMDRDGDGARQLGGLYSTLEYSLSSHVWIGGRYDLVGLPALRDTERAQAASLIGVYAPTEFSAFRLQAQHQWLPGGHTVDSIVGQLNFTIGVHPAHSY
ncbi:hypothetical protein LBMAG42_50600 [Deltaproteobacteria bacterium]|nr:hypothetical protein LBMAG42_50600 [Deltaproteobacteria bacterium]